MAAQAVAANDGNVVVDTVDPFDFPQDALQELLEIKGGDCPFDDQSAVAQREAELLRSSVEMGMSGKEFMGSPVWRQLPRTHRLPPWIGDHCVHDILRGIGVW